MKIQLLTSATAEPLTRGDAKRHIRVSTANTDNDTYIDGCIIASRQSVEQYINRKLMFQRWKVYFDDFPQGNAFEVPYPPLKSIPSTGLVYTGSSGGSTTLSSTKWDADTVSEPGRLVLDYNSDWPTVTLAAMNPVSIEFRCGYPSSASSSGHLKVPALIKHAMKLIIGDMFINRESIVVGAFGQGVQEIPMTAKRLLDSYRIKTF